MFETTLLINTPEGEQTVKLDGANFTVGRTELSDLALPDAGLSRRHATFENHDGEVWLFDENSTNGSFVNGERVSANGVKLTDGDEISIGNETLIFVQIRRKQTHNRQPAAPEPEESSAQPKQQTTNAETQAIDKQPIPKVLIVAGVSVVGIIGLMLAAILAVNYFDTGGKVSNQKVQPTPKTADIPVEVVNLRDDEADVEELISMWEVQEDPLKVEDVRDVKSTTREELNVSQAEWDKQRQRTRAGRGNLGGSAGSPNLGGRGLAPQRAKMAELGLINLPPPRTSLLPRDFTELVKLRLDGKLIEMPLATKDYVLDQIGTSAKGDEFTIFNPATFQSTVVTPGTDPFQNIVKLATGFEGQKYNINDGSDRVEFKRRLLRSISPQGKEFIEELARGYREKFNFPLLITSLIRTLEYQYRLTQTNPNATKAPNPPHASGHTFDMAFNQMSGVELRYIYDKLEEYEKAGRIDALFEAGNCIHIFVYPDRKPPKGF